MNDFCPRGSIVPRTDRIFQEGPSVRRTDMNFPGGSIVLQTDTNFPGGLIGKTCFFKEVLSVRRTDLKGIPA